MKQIAMGQWPAMSIASAMGEWEALRARRDAGEDLAGERRAERIQARGPVYLVGELMDDYMTEHVRRARKEKGVREVESLFRRVPAVLRRMPAADVTRTVAFDMIQSVSEYPVQAKYLRSEMGAAWDHALDAGRLPDTCPNWWRLILRGKLKSKGKSMGGVKAGQTKRHLSGAEVGALIRWLPNFSQTVDDALTLYLWTGARGAEIVGIEGRDVVLEQDGWWWVCPKAKTKNARHDDAHDLRVPLVGRALAIIMRRREIHGGGWLFPRSRGHVGHIEQKTVQEAVYYRQPYSTVMASKDRVRLTVTHWSPHDLRRTVRTHLASLGCPDAIAEAILGHMQEGIKGVYNLHKYDREKREWLVRLDAHLEGLASAL